GGSWVPLTSSCKNYDGISSKEANSSLRPNRV
ncbi:uncharacterized protein METZ01_LOCUS89094, partial [marine metagenome]